jgi:hypothetical protein
MMGYNSLSDCGNKYCPDFTKEIKSFNIYQISPIYVISEDETCWPGNVKVQS